MECNSFLHGAGFDDRLLNQQLRTSPSTQREQVAKSILGEWGIKSLAAFVQSAPNPTLLNDAAAV